jgi:hypothetical protein
VISYYLRTRKRFRNSWREETTPKEKEMKNIATLLLLVALGVLAVFSVRTTRGQTSGTTHMENAKVTQGDSATMVVVVDKASNRDGNVAVTALPNGSPNGGVTFSCFLQASQTQCKAMTTMPLEAKLGKWTIAEITFTPLPWGEVKVLSKHGNSTFDVDAHKGIVLPDSATVSDIK